MTLFKNAIFWFLILLVNALCWILFSILFISGPGESVTPSRYVGGITLYVFIVSLVGSCINVGLLHLFRKATKLRLSVKRFFLTQFLLLVLAFLFMVLAVYLRWLSYQT
jgi:hypothetical protein